MNTKLILAMAALLAVPTALGGAPYHRDSIGPTSVNIAGLGEFGVSVCDNGDPPLVAIIACGTGGIGAIIAVNETGGDWFDGTCSVEPGAPNTGGFYGFTCGTDRDDDIFVTNIDADSNDATDEYDDDFASGNETVSMIPICFRSDISAADDDTTNGDDNEFDDFAVFIAINVPEFPAAVGFFSVDIAGASGDGCGGDNASSHNHANFTD